MPEAIDILSLLTITMLSPLFNADFDDHYDFCEVKPRQDRKRRKQPKALFLAKRNPVIVKSSDRRHYH